METFFPCFLSVLKNLFLYSGSFNGNNLNNNKKPELEKSKICFHINLQVYFGCALKCQMENYDCILHGNGAFTIFTQKGFNINSILLF